MTPQSCSEIQIALELLWITLQFQHFEQVENEIGEPLSPLDFQYALDLRKYRLTLPLEQ